MTVTNYAEWKAAVAAEHKKLFEVSHYCVLLERHLNGEGG